LIVASVKEWVFIILIGSFKIIVLDSRVRKKIDLDKSYVENKLKALTLAAITFVCM